jgi:predicted membrane-bound mannosyltransferase
MRNLTIALATIVGSLGLATSAFAGETSSYNSYTNTHQYNGYSQTNVDAHVSSYEVQNATSTTTKVEAIADLGDVNVASVKFKDGKFEASADSRNGRPVDPVATIYVSTATVNSTKTTTENADIDTFSKYEFNSNNFTHEVGSKF